MRQVERHVPHYSEELKDPRSLDHTKRSSKACWSSRQTSMAASSGLKESKAKIGQAVALHGDHGGGICRRHLGHIRFSQPARYIPSVAIDLRPHYARYRLAICWARAGKSDQRIFQAHDKAGRSRAPGHGKKRRFVAIGGQGQYLPGK
jgi:hypothetical protein